MSDNELNCSVNHNFREGYCKGYEEGYNQGTADEYAIARTDMQSILDDEKRLSYVQGKADMLDSSIRAMKDKYYCVEDLCGESDECSECVVRYLELLKEQMNDGTNDNKS